MDRARKDMMLGTRFTPRQFERLEREASATSRTMGGLIRLLIDQIEVEDNFQLVLKAPSGKDGKR